MKGVEIVSDIKEGIIEWKIFYNKKQVGEFEFFYEKNKIWLWSCEIQEEYQKKGIGSFVISNAVQKFGEIFFCSAERIQLHNYYKCYDKRYLTTEGIKFKDSLVRKQIIKPEWYQNPCEL